MFPLGNITKSILFFEKNTGEEEVGTLNMGIDINDIVRAIVEGVLVNVVIYMISRFWTIIHTKSKTFDISGYWRGIAIENYRGTEYKGYDFYIIRCISTDRVRVKIFQITNKQQYHKYIGMGYLRGDKLMVSYEERNNSNSRMVGTLALRFEDKKEHETILSGTYVEFRGKGTTPAVVNYSIETVKLAILDRLCMLCSMKKWMKKNGEKMLK